MEIRESLELDKDLKVTKENFKNIFIYLTSILEEVEKAEKDNSIKEDIKFKDFQNCCNEFLKCFELFYSGFINDKEKYSIQLKLLKNIKKLLLELCENTSVNKRLLNEIKSCSFDC